jgi:hypothetical protein
MEIPPVFEPNEREIRRLRSIDSSFSELWDDYLEINRILGSLTSSKGQQRELHRLCSDLESEIRENLKSAS